MQSSELDLLIDGAVGRLCFLDYLRDGGDGNFFSVGEVGVKFNPWHDPANGRFTFGPGGRTAISRGRNPRDRAASTKQTDRYYRGRTEQGIRLIRPISGGIVDSSGHYVAEKFQYDPYRLTDPITAVAHYVGGSGESRNYYLNSVDTSSLSVNDFPKIEGLIKIGKAGVFEIVQSPARNFDSGNPFKLRKFSAANIVGRLAMEANGILIVRTDGRYVFNGFVGVSHDRFQFPRSRHRTRSAEALTSIGRKLPGKAFDVHIVETHPLTLIGQAKIGKKF